MSFRVAVFGSFHYGKALLERLLLLKQAFPEIEVVGVATDDPSKSWVSPHKRLWQYPHTKEEEEMVADLAKRHEIPVWRERVKTEEFRIQYETIWRPDVCYMAIFGQKIPENVWSRPLYGFFNFHSCAGREWPSNGGPQAFEGMAAAGENQASVAMHHVDDEFDHGPLVAFSPFYPLVAGETILSVFERSSTLVADLMNWHLSELLRIPNFSKTKPRIIASIGPTLTHRQAFDIAWDKGRDPPASALIKR